MTTDTPPTSPAAEKVAYTDIEDVIAAAAKARDAEADSISVEEIEAIAADLDIPAHLVAPAVQEVRRRREVKLAAERAQEEQRARRTKLATRAAAALAAVLLVAGGYTWSGLREAWFAVAQQRSQVINVVERRAETRAQWADAAESADKHAELSGAENRVRIERKRYDERVTEFNSRASGPLARLVGLLTGYPAQLPLSAEVDGW